MRALSRLRSYAAALATLSCAVVACDPSRLAGANLVIGPSSSGSGGASTTNGAGGMGGTGAGGSGGTGGTAIPSHCGDGMRSGNETDRDCGGSCAPCDLHAKCEMESDCATHFCFQEACELCSGASDCGPTRHCDLEGTQYCLDGALLPLGAVCGASSECTSNTCFDGVCCSAPCDSEPGCARSCRVDQGAQVQGHCYQRPDPFVGLVTNMVDPSASGEGLTGSWSYAGKVGVAAGDALCKAIGAEHVCSLAELRASDGVQHLGGLPKDQAVWLLRSEYVDDPTLAASPCANNASCPPGRECNPLTHLCAYPFGASARCDGFTYAGTVHAVGEWFRRVDDGAPLGADAVRVGSLDVHVSGGAPLCNDASKLGCAGPCDAKRALACCRKGCS